MKDDIFSQIKHDTERMEDQAVEASLLDSNLKQTKLIGDLSGVVDQLIDRVEERPTKKGVWKITGVVASIVVAVLMGLATLAYDSSDDALHEIKSCTTPSGECAERGAENTKAAVANIVCNQEKVVYFLDFDRYDPLSYCAEFINFEIDRTGADIPRVEVDPEVHQYGLHQG